MQETYTTTERTHFVTSNSGRVYEVRTICHRPVNPDPKDVENFRLLCGRLADEVMKRKAQEKSAK